jgi:hypothetical protein
VQVQLKKTGFATWNRPGVKIVFRNSIVLFYNFCVFSLALHNLKMFFVWIHNFTRRGFNYCSKSVLLNLKLLFLKYVNLLLLLYYIIIYHAGNMFSQYLSLEVFLNNTLCRITMKQSLTNKGWMNCFEIHIFFSLFLLTFL